MSARFALLRKSRFPRRLTLFLAAFAILFSSVIGTGLSASADNSTLSNFTGVAKSMSPQQQAQSYAYYKYLRQCFSYGYYSSRSVIGTNNWISIEKASPFDWFAQPSASGNGSLQTAKVGMVNDVQGGVVNVTDDSQQDCFGDTFKAIMKVAAPLWGYTGSTAGAKMLCDLGFTPEQGIGSCTSNLTGSGWRYNTPDNVVGKVDDWYKNTIGFKSTDVNAIQPTGGKYELYLLTFQIYCGKADPNDKAAIYQNIAVITPPNPAPTPTNYSQLTASHKPDSFANFYEGGGENCSQLAADLKDKSPESDLIKGMINWVQANKDTQANSGINCNVPTIAAANSAQCSSDKGTKTTCVIDGVGWIVCSVASFLATMADGMYGLISNFFKVPPVNVNTSDGTNGVYNSWVIIRNISNVVFVIIFLIIIFSQLTGLGVSNYGVKKALPRLVIGAVLVNISYWVGAIAVDVSNILGSGIYDLLQGVRSQMNLDINGNWVGIIGSLISGTSIVVSGGAVVGVAAAAAVVAAPTAIIYLAIPIVLSAVLAIFIVVFLLVARQAFVIILLIISPLAFVALLLPNTEKYFTKWRQTLTTLLLMYPIMSLIFGGSQIAGLAILSTAGSSAQTEADATKAGVAILSGFLIQVLPFFFIPFLITKFSGGNLDSIAKQIASRGQKMLSGVSNTARKAGMRQAGRSWEQLKYGGADTRLGRLRGRNSLFGVAGSGGRAYDQWQDRKKMTDETLAEERKKQTTARLAGDTGYAEKVGAGVVSAERVASSAQAKAEAAAIKEALAPLVRELTSASPAGRGEILEREISQGGARAAAAMQYAGQIGDGDFLRRQMTSGNAELARMANEAAYNNAGALKDKSPDVVKGASGAFEGAIKGSELAKWNAGTAEAFQQHFDAMAGQVDKQGNNIQQKMLANLAAAASEIQGNTNLQADFSGDAGKILKKYAPAGAIGDDGRITSPPPAPQEVIVIDRK